MTCSENNQSGKSCSNKLCANDWHPPPRLKLVQDDFCRLDARADTVDFRDQLYVPTLVEVPATMPVSNFMVHGIPILNQGREGACTGFAMATVAHYLLRTRKVFPDSTELSARMFYEMAKRYDAWSGEDYDGSSARGAMKGWHKHGICPEQVWPNQVIDRQLTLDRAKAAIERPLGAYFRVNHKDLISMHSAIAEVGVLYATAAVHSGWQAVGADGIVHQTDQILGGHAFAIVGYDSEGFWFQNSWGDQWGHHGFGRISYDDWLVNGSDVWVARLGVPIHSKQTLINDASSALRATSIYCDLRPHVITVCNNGLACRTGTYANDDATIAEIFEEHFPRITKDWKKKRIVLYAHGGLVDEESAIRRINTWRQGLLDHEIFPVAFIWNSDFSSTLKNILVDAFHGRSYERVANSPMSFLFDRLDDMLEPLVRNLGRVQWAEMKENALEATRAQQGVARRVAEHIYKLYLEDSDIEIHVVGHSAGATFHAPLVELLSTVGTIRDGVLRGETGFGMPIQSMTFWAPACTVARFKQSYLPALRAGQIKRFALFVLDDLSERSDKCAAIYHRSILYLVAHAFERMSRVPLAQDGRQYGTPILGMEKFVRMDATLSRLFRESPNSGMDLVVCPNNVPEGNSSSSRTRRHGEFDEDRHTLLATMARILNQEQVDLTQMNASFLRSFAANGS